MRIFSLGGLERRKTQFKMLSFVIISDVLLGVYLFCFSVLIINSLFLFLFFFQEKVHMVA